MGGRFHGNSDVLQVTRWILDGSGRKTRAADAGIADTAGSTRAERMALEFIAGRERQCRRGI
jgi:hypothetical protein